MLSFESDYAEGAHEKILERLFETNGEPLPGYGGDIYCERAKAKIREACQCPGAEVFFLVGGTQANAVIIDAMLHSYEGVVAAGTGHISVHEAGAIEHAGHKVIEVAHHLGKIDADGLLACLRSYRKDENREHMVFPGMVYISHPTEYGTLYTKEELKILSGICGEFGIPLYMDGARLGYGLAGEGTDVDLPFIASVCDVFYIGGTKVGAFCGEAAVFTKGNMPLHFMTLAKQRGALLAKGRLLGIQFDTLFTDELYFELGRHAVRMAGLLKEVLRQKGYRFYLESPTNQQFVILKDSEFHELKKKVRVSFWEKPDEGHTVVRFATSWATKEEDIKKLRHLC